MTSNHSAVDEILQLSNNIEIRERLIITLRAVEQRNIVLEQSIKKIEELRNSIQMDKQGLKREGVIETLNEILKESKFD